jgi:hypothetical protein
MKGRNWKRKEKGEDRNYRKQGKEWKERHEEK